MNEEQPSSFHFPSLSLALSVHVDDLALSGPKKKPFSVLVNFAEARST